jgi:phosphohistidine swiveling domain-containing protein
MAEWLLSGHNTQESFDISRPVVLTMGVALMHGPMSWFITQLAGNDAAFDPTLRAAVFVQGHCYLNINYLIRNVGTVLPFDPGSIGVSADKVPSELARQQGHLSIGQRLRLPQRFLHTYRWVADYYRQRQPTVLRWFTDAHGQLQREPAPSLTLLWSPFAPDQYAAIEDNTHAHITTALIIVALDDVLRQRAPQLLGLFAGRSTTTSLMGQRVWELCQIAKECGPQVRRMLKEGITDLDAYRTLAEADELVDGIQAFMRDYGYRGFRHEVDWATERLSDHPDHVLLAIAGQLDEEEPPEVRADAARQVALQALQKMDPVQRAIWRRVLRWGQQLIAWREASKNISSLSQATFGLAARHLARIFYPSQPDDAMMYYTLDEFLAFARSEGQQKVSLQILNHRRAQYELHRKQTPPPELIWYDPATENWRPAEEREESQEPARQMAGIAASGGSGPVEGIALVTNDPLEAGRRLLQMSGPVVLVTRLTDPAWSGLFRRLTAVVTELGGVVSHAAIVARENGLPAVVGIHGVTLAVCDGQRLRVNGADGTVEILE